MRVLLPLLMLAWGCAEAISDPQPPADMAVQMPPPFLGPDARAMVPPGDAGGLPPPVGQDAAALPPPGGDCNPGMRLGLCQVCSPQGRPIAAMEDPACPLADCAVFDQFMVTQDAQGVACFRVARRPVGGNCSPDGRCRVADAAYCADVQREEVLRADECGTIAGCEGEEPPEVMPAPQGTACPGGTCRADGTCNTEAIGSCEDFDREDPCRGGQDISGSFFCEFVFDGQSCRDACLSQGGRCLAAWVSAGGCNPGEPLGCLDEAASVLCRCTKE